MKLNAFRSWKDHEWILSSAKCANGKDEEEPAAPPRPPDLACVGGDGLKNLKPDRPTAM